MEIVFIRHGQGEHNLPVPDRLGIYHLHLTSKGRTQVEQLKSELNISNDDLFIVSPMVRTLETASILTQDTRGVRLNVTPIAGPRMFPQNPEYKTSNCDRILSRDRIKNDFPSFEFLDFDEIDFKELWDEGINEIEDRKFSAFGKVLITWAINQGFERTFIIAHDGTITSYRILLGEEGLSRSDFLGEAGIYKVNL